MESLPRGPLGITSPYTLEQLSRPSHRGFHYYFGKALLAIPEVGS